MTHTPRDAKRNTARLLRGATPAPVAPLLALVTLSVSAGLVGHFLAHERDYVFSGLIAFSALAAGVVALALWWRRQIARAERARYDAALRDQSLTRYLEFVSENANDVILQVDDKGFVVRANDRVAEYYGRSKEEMVGLDMRLLRAPQEAKHFDADILRIRREGRLRFSTAHRRLDGAVFPVDVSARGFEVEGRWFFQAIVRDVSERENALAALRASEENLQITLQSIGDGVIATDAAGLIHTMNPVAERLTDWSLSEARGRHLDDVVRFVSEKTRQPLESPAARVLRERTSVALANHTLLLTRAGDERPVSHSAAPIQGREGELTGVVMVLRDVAEERAAQRNLAFQAELLQNLSDGVVALDANHRVLAWNLAAEEMYGIKASDAFGKTMGELLTSEYEGFPSFKEFAEALDWVGKIRVNVRRTLRNGTVLDVEASGVVLRGDDEQITGYVSVSRDITARRRATEALRESQGRLSRILEASNDAIWVIGADGRTEFANARAATLLETVPDEMIGRTTRDFFHPESLSGESASHGADCSLGESLRREVMLRRSDGSEKWLVHSRSALRTTAGEVIGAVHVLMDVTELRRAREQLLQSQKMEAVGQLASGIAHDFNNLLLVIMSSAEFLRENLPPDDPNRTDVGEICDAGERASHLVRHLLAFGRKSTHKPVTVDINGVVQGLEKLLRRAIGENVGVSVSLGRDLWPTRIDPVHLEQVLMNLSVNARDAMPDGGKLRIETRNVSLDDPPAECRDLPPGRHVALTVSDTGCGMSPEVAARIFEPFFTTKGRGQGTGLGLATVYGIVSQASGKITVASELGQGTTFAIYLPACEVIEHETTDSYVLSPATGQGETVLLVEDDSAVRRIARRMLEEGGYLVLETSSVKDALHHLHEGARIDVILSDIVMPEVSGLDLATAAGSLDPPVPVVLMSGYSEARQRAAHDVLPKPFTQQALNERIRYALQARRASGKVARPAAILSPPS